MNPDNIEDRRTNFMRSIRRQGRLNFIAQKRKEQQPIMKQEEGKDMFSHLDNHSDKDNLITAVRACLLIDEKTFNIVSIKELINSQNIYDKHKGVIVLRKQLMNCGGKEQFIQKVFDLGIIPHLLSFMRDGNQPHLLLEATWCIANLTVGSTNQVDSMINRGLLLDLKRVLLINNEKIFEQASWVVGNIATEGSDYRQKLLELEFGAILTTKLLQTNDSIIIKNTTWALSNLCRGAFLHNSQTQSIPAFLKVLMKFNGERDNVINSMLPLADLIDKNIGESLCEGNNMVVFKTIALKYPNLGSVISPLLSILCTIASGTSEQCAKLVEMGFIEIIFMWLRNHDLKTSVVKDALYCISNFLIDSDDQIGVVFKNQVNYNILKEYCFHDAEIIQKEAIWCLANVTQAGSDERIHGLVQNEIFLVFADTLRTTRNTIIMSLVLEGISNILEVGKEVKAKGIQDYAIIMEKEGLLGELEDIQFHANLKVSSCATEIIEKYLEVDDSDYKDDVLSLL